MKYFINNSTHTLDFNQVQYTSNFTFIGIFYVVKNPFQCNYSILYDIKERVKMVCLIFFPVLDNPKIDATMYVFLYHEIWKWCMIH